MKHVFESLVVHQNHPVEDTEAGVADDEGQQVVPDQLENRPLPHNHQVDEALASLAGVTITIRINVAQHFDYVKED